MWEYFTLPTLSKKPGGCQGLGDWISGVRGEFGQGAGNLGVLRRQSGGESCGGERGVRGHSEIRDSE